MNSKLFTKLVLFMTVFICILLAGITIYVDALFHYHAPIKSLEYDIRHERYVNNGISRHFEYDAIVIGTSLTESVKTSDVETIFRTKTIKIPYAGAGYKELNEALCHALEYNPETKIVFRCLDSMGLVRNADYVRYENTPEYLYDDNLWNDIKYLLNKDILLDYTFHTLLYTRDGNKTTTFDDYANWDSEAVYGQDSLDNVLISDRKEYEQVEFVQEDYEKISKNIEQNIIPAVKNNPNTIFYMFFSPYHVSYWNDIIKKGTFDYYINAEKLAVQELLKYDNVRVFSFMTDLDFLCNNNYYKDQLHYSSEANAILFKYMAEDKYRITRDNYENHYELIANIFRD